MLTDLQPHEEPLWMAAYAAAIQAELFLYGMGGRFEAWPSFYRDVADKTPGVADTAIIELRKRRGSGPGAA